MTTRTERHDMVRVLVAQAEGSAPREAGAAMLVWADGFSGTIGGGALEHEAIAAARGMLGHSDWHRELRSYPLGPALGQCCGGMVRLLFEHISDAEGGDIGVRPLSSTLGRKSGQGGKGSDPYVARTPALVVRPVAAGVPTVLVRDRTHTADWPLPVLRAVRQMLSGERPCETLLVAGGKTGPAFVIEPEARPPHPLYLYGAGHVGRAVVRALEGLPFAITWIDVAADRFPATNPSSASRLNATDLAAVTAAAPPEALHLVMTFSHALDLAIVHAVLSRPFTWAGLIGSATKRARFEKRLREAGIPEAALARLQCPIGIGGINGKEPAMIAISVAAQLAAWASDGRAGSARLVDHA